MISIGTKNFEVMKKVTVKSATLNTLIIHLSNKMSMVLCLAAGMSVNIVFEAEYFHRN
jgi:hypothetical protein